MEHQCLENILGYFRNSTRQGEELVKEVIDLLPQLAGVGLIP